MNEREKWLRELTKQHIADAIEDDINGERIMKEVWEACEGRDDQKVVEDQMRVIVKMLRPKKRVSEWGGP